MSDAPQGPGWWQASDGKWYPPAEPSAPPPPPPGGGFAPPSAGAPPGYSPPPSAGPPPGYSTPTTGPAPGYGYGGPPAPGNYAPWGRRVVATLLDALILLPLSIIASIFTAADTLAIGLLFNALVFVASLYFAYLTGATGQSPGKRLIGIKVIGERSGQPIGGGLGIARVFIHIIDALACFLGYLWPLWDHKRQTFTDKVMSTVVLDNLPTQSFNADLFKA